LDGNVYKLTPEMLVIADALAPVAVAGIIGGAESGVTEETTDIILEAASFGSASVRRTGRDLNIRTDAVMRFEKNVPSGLVPVAAARAALLVVALCGGKITAHRDVSAKKQTAKRISISSSDLCARIGVNLSPATVKKYLEALGFAVTATAKNIAVSVP
jgi:phenylalanyl-tRNA synthetase beta chain